MIKAVFFDLDNTLIDFLRMKKMSIEAGITAMIDAGLKFDKQKLVKKLYKLYDKYTMEDPLIFQRVMVAEFGNIDYKALANAIVAYRKVRASFLEPYPQVHATLLKPISKGIRIGIISDAPRLKAWIRLANMKISDYPSVVVTYDDTKKLKPHDLPFKVALKRLKLKPKECLMVGDRPDRDIKGAKKNGMHTCFARYGNPKIKKTNADFEIDNIKEVIGVVEKISRKV